MRIDHPNGDCESVAVENAVYHADAGVLWARFETVMLHLTASEVRMLAAKVDPPQDPPPLLTHWQGAALCKAARESGATVALWRDHVTCESCRQELHDPTGRI